MSKFAKTVKKMSQADKIRAEFEVEIFARDCGFSTMGIERHPVSGEYSGTGYSFSEDSSWGIDIVRCPHCNEIQACWGQFGDPATENTICTVCNQVFEVEPF